MQFRQFVCVATLCAVCLVAGCQALGSKDESKFVEGPPVEEVVKVMQGAVDQIMASDAWKPFEDESDNWVDRCGVASEASDTACTRLQNAAFDACAAQQGASAVVVAETCKRVFSGDRTVCKHNPTKEMQAWCELAEPTAECQAHRKAEAVVCSASKATPHLTLVSAKLVANVVHSDARGGSIGLAVISFEGSRAISRASSVEIELALRPLDPKQQSMTEDYQLRSWSPALEVRRLLNVERRGPSKKSPIAPESDRSEANVANTVVAALKATSTNFSQQGKDRVVPLRPKAFTFEFAFEAIDKGALGVNIDLAPVPLKIGANASREHTDGNKLVLVFGPDPGAQ